MGLIRIAGLPAIEELEKEGWRIIEPEDKRTRLRILILNLMPLKQQTERQLLRRLAAAEPVTEAVFLTTASYVSTHVDPEHLKTHYKTFSQIRKEDWDGLIITGAPVEHMAFEEVAYWEELTQIMAWSEEHVHSVLHICWGAQAGLYYHYGIPKRSLEQKQFGIYPHHIVTAGRLTERMEEPFPAPHSRHTFTAKEDVEKVKELQLVAESPLAGVYLLVDEKRRSVFVTGHSEYEADTLAQEYRRDLGKGLPIELPYHYFPGDDAEKEPVSVWDRHSETLFDNWLRLYVSSV